MLTARIATLSFLLSMFVQVLDVPAARSAVDTRVDPWTLTSLDPGSGSPSLTREPADGWRRPYLQRLEEERLQWWAAWGVVLSATSTVSFAALAADLNTAVQCSDGCFEVFPLGLWIAVPAAGMTTLMASGGAGAAGGTLRLIDRRIRDHWDPMALGPEFRQHGWSLAAVGYSGLAVALVVGILAIRSPWIIPLAATSLVVGTAFVHAGDTWLLWAKRVTEDHGAVYEPPRFPTRGPGRGMEGLPALLELPVP